MATILNDPQEGRRTEPSLSSPTPSSDPVFTCTALLITATVGGLVGCTSYSLLGGTFESMAVPWIVAPNSPRLSYGQQFVLIMTPLAGLYGAAIVSSVAFCLNARFLRAAAGLVTSTLVVGAIVSYMWRSDAIRYDHDVSQLVLYAPFAGMSAVALTIASICIVCAVLRGVRRETP